jgi:hypothetical protein
VKAAAHQYQPRNTTMTLINYAFAPAVAELIMRKEYFFNKVGLQENNYTINVISAE